MIYNILFEKLENIKLKGLTKSILTQLNRLDINTIYDLFYFFPKGYENSAIYCKIQNVRNDKEVILCGEIMSINRTFLSGKRIMVKAFFTDKTGIIELIWFNNRFVYSSLKAGDEVLITGKIKNAPNFKIINPSYKKNYSKNNMNENSKLEPIYSLTKGLTQNKIRYLIKNVIDKFGYLLQENIPIDFLYNNKIMSRQNAIAQIHFPSNEKALDLAIRRFTYEEIMILEMGILEKRYIDNKKNLNRYTLEDSKDLVKKYVKTLPYELTNSQKKVITSIYKELKEGKYINRLIQGDVGSGKTVVAMIIILYMAENNYQSVLLAPTEILAIQHFNNVCDTFSSLNIRCELLTSSVKGKKREKILNDIKEGKIDVVIGTHSVIQKEVNFKNLGLSVIDEQQRFGVEQRNELRNKSSLSNIIVMSATPIPRSLALTIYGDLDVSIISEMPSSRKKVITKWIKNEAEEEKMYEFINKKVKEGYQVYIVAYLIEDSNLIKAKSAISTYEEICTKFPDRKIGLLHGKMKSKEKKEIMEEFNDHKIDILVSTTVIEVGVDVKNANIILITNAERFGLSTLHQLRGRVGRSSKRGYCFLLSNSDNEISKKRLEILETQTDGFKISEEDLKLRNSGEIFGVKQSGISDLVLLDIVKNIKEIERVKLFVNRYLEEHNGEISNEYLIEDIKYKHNRR